MPEERRRRPQVRSVLVDRGRVLAVTGVFAGTHIVVIMCVLHGLCAGCTGMRIAGCFGMAAFLHVVVDRKCRICGGLATGAEAGDGSGLGLIGCVYILYGSG